MKTVLKVIGIVVVVLIALGIATAILSDSEQSTTYTTTETSAVSENVEAAEPEIDVVSVTEETTEVKLSVSIGKLNALRKAEQYLDIMGFSKKGLREQLEYEEYESDEIDYALENCTANWNEECVEKANTYLAIMGFSRSGLHDQLEYEGFTESEIKYALNEVGY